MYRTTCFLLYLLCVWQARAQEWSVPENSPGQHHDLSVRLHPENGILDGRLALTFHNQTGDTLCALPFHLWAAALDDRQSAYGRQQLALGHPDFHFTSAERRIGYTSLTFRSGGKELPHHTEKDHRDLVWVPLGVPLAPGDSIAIEALWSLRLPGFQSRLGTDGEIWQMAHWFPKLARHDGKEWRLTPYLEWGEFCHDYGNYHLHLTVPDTMTVTATGWPADSLTSRWCAMALTRSRLGQPGLPPEPEGWRTWHFEARWVPDVAWAASSAFLMRERPVTLSGGRQVTARVCHTPERAGSWQTALEAVARSLAYFDGEVAPYPWPQATAVQGARSFSGGMEYPMLTFIQAGLSGGILETVIAHEVGHNWFYGLLASDERRHPWLDEGLNTFFEKRYVNRYGIADPLSSAGVDQDEILLMDRALSGSLPLPSRGVEGLASDLDYSLGAYTIPARIFGLLAREVGEEALIQAIRDYAREWSFRHPEPDDLRRSLEQSLDRDLTWLFDHALNRPFARDMGIRKVERRPEGWKVQVYQRPTVGLPWRLAIGNAGQAESEILFPGFEGPDTVVLLSGWPDAGCFSVHDPMVPDLRQGNDGRSSGGRPLRCRDARIGWLFGFRTVERPQGYLLPWVGWNATDGWMPGLAIHNQRVHYQPAGYFAGVGFGTRTGEWVMNGSVHVDNYALLAAGFLRLAVRAATFHHLDLLHRWWRVSPSLEWQSRAGRSHTEPLDRVGLYAWWIQRASAGLGDAVSDHSGTTADRILALRLSREMPGVLWSWRAGMDVEGQTYRHEQGRRQGYIKAGLEGQVRWRFFRHQWLQARAFAGWFPWNTRRHAGLLSHPDARGALAMAFQAHNDYRFDDVFLARSAGDGRHQIYPREGGFKTALGPGVSEGQSNHALVTFHLSSGLPFDLPAYFPVRLYVDAGWWSDRRPDGIRVHPAGQFWCDAGVKLSLWEERMEVYFPLWQNRPLRRLMDVAHPSFGSRISWTVRFDLFRLPLRPLSVF